MNTAPALIPSSCYAIPGTFIRIDHIIDAVCHKYNVVPGDLSKRTRKREIVEPRQICIAFAFKFFRLPSSQIMPLFGHIDHATIIHSCKVVSNMYLTDKTYRENINAFGRNINASEEMTARIIVMKKSELSGRWDTYKYTVS